MTKLPAIFLLFMIQVSLISGLNAQNNPQELYVINDLAYLNPLETTVDSLQRLNLILPKGLKQTPLLIWIGGGAWAYVDRNREMEFAKKMAREGVAVAAIGHRLSAATWQNPEWDHGVQHPAHIEDVAAAFKWLYDHAEDYGYDKNKIFVGGYSSGGHLAALLALDPSYLTARGLNLNNIKGAIPMAGAYDIAAYHQGFLTSQRPELAKLHVEAVFGSTIEEWIKASPTTFVANAKTPMLVVTENQSHRYTDPLIAAFKEVNFTAFELLHAPDLGHVGLLNNISQDENSDYRQKLIDFIRRESEKEFLME